MSEANLKTIERVYQAFGRGDVPFILSVVGDGTVWDFNVAESDVPWHAPVHGKHELPRFFQAMGENMTMEAFEPRHFLTDGRNVVVRLRLAYTVRKTGRRVDEEQVQWWSFDEAGRITGLRHFEDTAKVLAAFRP